MIDYVCNDCGLSGVKLWREYQTFLDHQVLRCVSCALLSQKDSSSVRSTKEIVDDAGFRVSQYFIMDAEKNHSVSEEEMNENCYIHIARTDQIGWLVPAILTEEGDTYWGYSSTPIDRILWWRKLPTYQGGISI